MNDLAQKLYDAIDATKDADDDTIRLAVERELGIIELYDTDGLYEADELFEDDETTGLDDLELLEDPDADLSEELPEDEIESYEDEQAEPATAAAPAPVSTIPSPLPTVDWLWRALVGGLIAVILISLIGVIWASVDGDPDTSATVLVTIAVASLTGLLGLFVTPKF